MSTLLQPEDQQDGLTADEMLAVVSGLLIAGTRGVSNQMANAIHTFASQPRAWRQLRLHPELIPSAVEEVIRWEPASEAVVRCPMEDIEINGRSIEAGTILVLSSLSANQDLDALSAADRFDITRTPPPSWHLATFGGGVHYCLGAHLARLEIGEALAVLSERLPDLHLDGGPLPNPPGAAFSRSYASLPVRWAQPSGRVPIGGRCR